MIVLDAEVQRRAREIQGEFDLRAPLRARITALRRQVRTLVEQPPELAHTDEAGAFATKLNALVPAKHVLESAHSSVLERLVAALTDLLERCRNWHLTIDGKS